MSNRVCSDLVKLTVLSFLAITVVTGGCGGGGGGTVTTGGTAGSTGMTGTTGGATGTVSSATSAGGQPSVDGGGRYDGDGTPTVEPDASANPDVPTSTLAEAGADGSEDTLITTTDLYAGLPAITPSGNSATVGVAGAHIAFPEGIILDVPAGAFTSDTTIQVFTTSQVPPEQAGFGSPLTPIIELLPNGLTFDLPMRLQIAMPAGGINNLMAVSSDPGDLYSEDLALSQGSDGSLQATIWSFSDIGIYATDWGSMTVFDVPCPTDHNTKAVLGLSSQIRDVFINSFGGQLVPITGPGVFNAGDPLGMLVQPTVLKQITNALTDAPHGAPLFAVTSGWRSLAQQFILSVVCGTGGNSVAAPGDSNHADGSAIDLTTTYSTQQCFTAAADLPLAELRELMHPDWGDLLEKYKFMWYGDENPQKPCSDRVHFDYPPAQSTPLKSASVQAFQRLWNNNNPCAAIAEDGVFGPDTEMALAGSPVVGWPANPSEAPIQLPAQGAGCSGTDMCCPGNPPSCQPTCECVPTTCAAAGETCVGCGAPCGDGVLETGEGCDDGNASSGDGCSADCSTVEMGWECPVPGVRCFPLCGDGKLIGSEMCDDGNSSSGDGCSNTCQVEPGYGCPTPGKPCTHM